MAEQTQPALAPGQVWRSPCGNRTRTVVEVSDVIVFTANRRALRRYWCRDMFAAACDGWTLDAPAETKEI